MIFRKMTFRFPNANQLVERHIRRKLQSLYLVCFQPLWLQIKPSDHPFVSPENLWITGKYKVTFQWIPCTRNVLQTDLIICLFCKSFNYSVAIIVRDFFSRLQEKPVRLSTRHHCKIKSYTIWKSKFPLKMISIAFQSNPNHVLKLNDF